MVIFPAEIATPYDWESPDGITKRVRGKQAYLDVIARHNHKKPEDEVLVVWVYMKQFHGELNRRDLDKTSDRRRIIVWQRSGHELICNTPALEWLEITVELAEKLAALGATVSANFSVHADTPVAPEKPSFAVAIITTRKNAEGNVMAAEGRVTVDRALRAITINAAYTLGLENEIGSIRAGKIADFTVLKKSPYDLAPSEIKDIKIWGTVFEGRRFPIRR